VGVLLKWRDGELVRDWWYRCRACTRKSAPALGSCWAMLMATSDGVPLKEIRGVHDGDNGPAGDELEVTAGPAALEPSN
jgi:hypothetical protein